MAGKRKAKVEKVRICRSVEKWFPAPFLFAVILLFIVFTIALAIQGTNPCEWMQYMYDGFWGLLAKNLFL